MAKRALICGISGQDGTYLAQLLLNQGYEVWGSSRDAELATFEHLRRLGLYDSVQLVSLNLRDVGSVLGLLRRIRPDEIFSLAGQSSVGLSFEQPVETIESIGLGTLSLLEAIRLSERDIRLYNAGSTECFGDTGDSVANEGSPLHPCSPYAVAKASAYWTVSNYRESYGMFACTGILSNHDSPLRPRRFVTRKIIHAVALLASGMDVRLSLGNLNIERDWGWAPEYVEAIAAMLNQSSPADYIIATGKSHTLLEFVETAFGLIGKDWPDCVSVDESLMRPTDILHNKVDPSKAAKDLGWKAKIGMKQVIGMMLEAEMVAIHKEKGELVTEVPRSTSALSASCKICSGPSPMFGENVVLRKYRVRYFRCERCGFMQTETPYWLAEAYSAAIAVQDVGIMQRNLSNRDLTSGILNLLFPKVSRAIDYGAGHGVFVRLMRDSGFNFYWSDPHATNNYACGFEREEGRQYDFLTAFEVLEHLEDPVSDLSKLMDLSDNVFVSTCIVPHPTPGLSDWWYYTPTTGQHIAFYTREALQLLADRFGRNLISNGSYHLFTKETQNKLLVKLAFNRRFAQIVSRIRRKPSLVEADFQRMIG